MDRESLSRPRFAAPAALLLAAVAVFIVLVGSLGGGSAESEAPGGDGASAEQSGDSGGEQDEAADGSEDSGEGEGEDEDGGEGDGENEGDGSSSGVYEVEPGDTLGGIADKTGLTVERLKELNPELDAQTLSPGQEIKISG